MIGQVGKDSAGDAQISNLAEVGVDTTNIARDPFLPTGTAFIGVECTGQNRIVVIPGANGSFQPERLAVHDSVLKSSRIALFQLEIPLATVTKAIEYARAGGALVILDPAPAPDHPLRPDLLAQVDYLTPNLSELAILTGRPLHDDSPVEEIVVAARTLGARAVLAKMGERGVLIVTADKSEHVPAFKVAPVDTTAAGDCFNAAFAIALTQGKTERDAAIFANAAAACSVTRIGAQPSMPTIAEVQRLIRAQPPE